MKKKVLIVISDYYEEIGKNLLKGSINELKLNNINYDILFAPGCFEIPFLISKNITLNLSLLRVEKTFLPDIRETSLSSDHPPATTSIFSNLIFLFINL